ncbi:MAG: hypothetical protein WCP97_07920 [bacterium]
MQNPPHPTNLNNENKIPTNPMPEKSITQQIIDRATLDKTQPISFNGIQLENACYFPPQPGFHIPENFWKTSKDPNLKEEIQTLWTHGPVGVAYANHGWGHAVEAYAQAQSLARMGIPTILFDILEIYPKNLRNFFRTGLYLSNEWLQKKGIIKMFPQEPKIFPAVLRTLNKIYRLFERPFSRPITTFIKEFKLSHLTSSHPLPLGLLRKKANSITNNKPFFFSQWIPDHFGPLALAYAIVNHPAIYNGVFDEEAKVILHKLYHVPENNITVWGNQLGPESIYLTENNPHAEALKNTKDSLTILLTASGSGAEGPIMEKFLHDFAPELQKKNSRYRLILFVGNHKALKLDIERCLQNLVLTNSPHVELFSCTSLLEVAAYRGLLPAFCPCLGAKCGEPAIQVGLGYAYLSFGPTTPNEYYNEKYAIKTLQAGLKLPNWKTTNLLTWFTEKQENKDLTNCSTNGYTKAIRYGIFEHALWIRNQITKHRK